MKRFSLKIHGRAAIVTLVVLAGVVYFLPDEPVDPWETIPLQKLGVLFVTLGFIQILSSFLVARFGASRGRVLSGFLAGLVSSTAYAVRASRRSRVDPENSLARAGGVVSANLAMAAEAAVLLRMIGGGLLEKMLPIFAGFFVGGVLALFVLRRRNGNDEAEEPAGLTFDAGSALQLTAVIAGLLLVTSWGKDLLGNEGLGLLTVLTSLFEVHGAVIANGRLAATGVLSMHQGAALVLVALASAHLSKVVIGTVLGSRRFALATAGTMSVMAAGGAVGYFFFMNFS